MKNIVCFFNCMSLRHKIKLGYCYVRLIINVVKSQMAVFELFKAAIWFLFDLNHRKRIYKRSDR